MGFFLWQLTDSRPKPYLNLHTRPAALAPFLTCARLALPAPLCLRPPEPAAQLCLGDQVLSGGAVAAAGGQAGLLPETGLKGQDSGPGQGMFRGSDGLMDSVIVYLLTGAKNAKIGGYFHGSHL